VLDISPFWSFALSLLVSNEPFFIFSRHAVLQRNEACQCSVRRRERFPS